MKWFAALLAPVLLGLAAVSNAWAHAEPATAKPGDGAVLRESPPEIVLEMSQEMGRQAGLNDIDVLDASGKEVTTTAAVVDNNDRKKLSVSLPPNLPAGVYTVRWKTSSAEDGDPANGQTSFTVDPNGTPSLGKEQLREDLLGGVATPPASDGESQVSIGAGSSDGVTWILVVAVGIGMLVLGAGGTFMLIQRKP